MSECQKKGVPVDCLFIQSNQNYWTMNANAHTKKI